MRRELGAFERAQALTGERYAYNAVAVLRLAGRPRPERLEEALAAAQRRHPLLRARLRRVGARFWFETDDYPTIPLQLLERSTDNDWRGAAEEEINTAIDTTVGPLARCVLLASPSDDNASELLLTFHHTIIDAACAATVCRELLAAVGGERPAGSDSAAERLPPPAEARFPARLQDLRRSPTMAVFMLRQLAGEAVHLWHARSLGAAVHPSPARCRLLPRSLGEAATRALVRRCRKERVPLNSALNAALLLAVQRHRRAGRPTALRHFVFPDLRPYLEPPMGPETVASYLVVMRFVTRLGAEESFWGLARQIGERLYRSFGRGEKFLFSLTTAGLMRLLLRLGKLRMGAAALSYTGPLELPAAFGELGLRGVHAFVTNPPIGAELTAQSRLFRGRIWWDFAYLEADMDAAQAETITADVIRRLEEAADAPR